MSDDLTTFLASSAPEYKNPPPPRLQVLYSDIYRQKESNAEGFKSSIAWWTKTLKALVSAGKQPHSSDHLILHMSNHLLDALRWEKSGRPLGLGAVVEELVSTHELLPLQPFLKSQSSPFQQPGLVYRVASTVLGAPLWWALSQLSLTDGASASGEQRWEKYKGDYIFSSSLKSTAEAILAHQKSKPHNITEFLYTRTSFRREFGSVGIRGQTLSELDASVILRYLERDVQAIITDGDLIKFTHDLDASIVLEGITEIDRGVLEMKVTLQKLNDQISELESQIQSRLTKIKDLLGQGSKTLAMSYLRSKKQLEELLTKRLGSQETLQTVLSRIESAATDIEIMKAYETSAKTLKSILQHPSLQQASIDETMEHMSDALADYKEIQDAIDVGNNLAADVAGVPSTDDQELTDELAALVREQETEKELAAKFAELELRHKQAARQEGTPEPSRSSPDAQANESASKRSAEAISA